MHVLTSLGTVREKKAGDGGRVLPQSPNSQLPTPNSQLPTPNSQLPTSIYLLDGSRPIQARDSITDKTTDRTTETTERNKSFTISS
ncbi:hypothetical protein BTUL_0110g00180 [Botrytis tulipae]|uniref:Uncharacterized protein n=1 Tax=Botrytis tulipae TaxID=87230 RepID=A0A4Z1EQW2_9HELO|nr:hypothetical protein BTUL_0110g00180 [Botrytis tulipae]